MVIGPITEAHVEIDADVGDAESDIAALDASLEQLEALANEVSEDIEDSFSEMVRAVRRDFQRLVSDNGLDELGRQAEREAARIARAMEVASRVSDEALDQIGGADAFADLVLQAQAAGRAIDVAFRDSTGRLRDSGGRFIPAGTFTGVVVEGSAAAKELALAFQEAGVVSRDALRDIGGADTFGPVVASAEAAGESVEQSFRQASRVAQQEMAQAGSAGILAFGKLRTAALYTAAGVGITSAAVTAFGVVGAARLEQTQIGFEALLGSAQEAQAFIEEMQQFAARTPFEFQGLADNARRLLAIAEAAGLARDEIIPTTETIGDLVAVLGAPADSIDRVVRALGQMASRGKVSTQELLQLSEALPGFAPFQALADGLGITTGELQKLVESGAIPATEGIDLLLQGMKEFPGAAGAMAKQAETLIGVFSTFKDTIQIALTDAFQPLIPAIKSALSDAIPVIENTLATLAPALSDLAGGLIGTLVDVFDAVGPSFGVAMQGLADGLGSVFETIGTVAGDFAPVLEALAPLFAAIGEALQPVLGVIGTLAATALPPFLSLLANVVTILGPVLDVVGGALTTLVEALEPFFAQLGASLTAVLQTAVPLLEGLADVFARVFEAVEPLIPPINQFISILAGGLMEALDILGPALEDVADAALDAFVEMIDAIGPDLPELARSLASIAISLAEILAALTPLLVPVFKLGALFVQLNVFTHGLVFEGIALLLGALADVVSFLSDNAGPAFDTVMATLSSFWHDVLVPLGEFIAGTFVAALVGLGEILAGTLMVAVDAVTIAVSFLWNDVLVPLGDFLWTVLQPALVALAAVMFGPLAVAVTAVSIAANALWNFVLVPLGRFLSDVLTPVIGFVANALSVVLGAAITGVTTAASFLWNSVLVPLGGFLSGALSAAIGAAKGAWDLFRGAVETVGSAVTTLLSAAIGPVTAALQFGLGFAIGVAKGAFEVMKGAIDLVSGAIETLIGWIESAIGFVDRLIERIGSIPGGGIVGDVVGAIPGVGAEGGIFDRPTNMIIGEDGKEVLLPLTDPRRTLELAERSGLFGVLGQAMGGGAAAPVGRPAAALGAGGSGPAIIEIRNYFAPGTSASDADRIAERQGQVVADVLDGRAARVEARIA